MAKAIAKPTATRKDDGPLYATSDFNVAEQAFKTGDELNGVPRSVLKSLVIERKAAAKPPALPSDASTLPPNDVTE